MRLKTQIPNADLPFGHLCHESRCRPIYKVQVPEFELQAWEVPLKKRSHYDDVPEDLVHQPHVLDATTAELNQLIQLLLPESLAVLQRSATCETAGSSAAALEAEARKALRTLLDTSSEAGLDTEETPEDIAWRRSLEEALSQEIHSSLSVAPPYWLDTRACDLARTVAAALIEFERSGMTKTSGLTKIIDGDGERYWSLVGDLCSRFALSRLQTFSYLGRVRTLLVPPDLQDEEARLTHVQLVER